MTETTGFRPLTRPIKAPTVGPNFEGFNHKRTIQDVHNLLLAVAELQARLLEAESRAATMAAEIAFLNQGR